MHWTCSGRALGMLWACSGPVLGLLWDCSWHALGILLPYMDRLARTYLQLPLRQWGAGNVYLLVLSSWKVNIAKNHCRNGVVDKFGLFIKTFQFFYWWKVYWQSVQLFEKSCLRWPERQAFFFSSKFMPNKISNYLQLYFKISTMSMVISNLESDISDIFRLTGPWCIYLSV